MSTQPISSVLTKVSLVVALGFAGACAPAMAAMFRLSDPQLDLVAKSKGFAKQTVLKGMHRSIQWPWVTRSANVSYQFAFNSTANYTIAAADQLDYNKLPGFADCGTIDLSRHGAMFGWRWNKATNTLQISAYANARGVHQNHDTHPATVTMVELDMADIQSFAPLQYDIQIDGAQYRFSVSGVLPSGRIVSAKSTLPRGCTSGATQLKAGSHLYFGGNRVAPANTSGYVKWINR